MVQIHPAPKATRFRSAWFWTPHPANFEERPHVGKGSRPQTSQPQWTEYAPLDLSFCGCWSFFQSGKGLKNASLAANSIIISMQIINPAGSWMGFSWFFPNDQPSSSECRLECRLFPFAASKSSCLRPW